MKTITEKIIELKKKKNAVILAHYYQEEAIQDLADYVGDSLGLSQKAAETDADVIVFAGVHFMAETAKILSPNKKVILPDGSRRHRAREEEIGSFRIAWHRDHPDHVHGLRVRQGKGRRLVVERRVRRRVGGGWRRLERRRLPFPGIEIAVVLERRPDPLAVALQLGDEVSAYKCELRRFAVAVSVEKAVPCLAGIAAGAPSANAPSTNEASAD